MFNERYRVIINFQLRYVIAEEITIKSNAILNNYVRSG